VLLTLEGVDYRRRPGAPLDLSKVKLWGQEPVLWSNEIGEVSYLVRLDAQSRYSFGPDAFEWPSDSWTECEAGDDWQRVETWHADRLWFTGFHNKKLEIERKVNKSLWWSRIIHIFWGVWEWGQAPWPHQIEGEDLYWTDKSVFVRNKVIGPGACNSILDPETRESGGHAGKTVVSYKNFPPETRWRFEVTVNISATGSGLHTGIDSLRLFNSDGQLLINKTLLASQLPYFVSTNIIYNAVTVDSSGRGTLVTYEPQISIANYDGDSAETRCFISVTYTLIK